MIVTKKEFREMFGLKHASELSRLLKNKTIVANESQMIDLDEKTNKKFVANKKREEKKKQAASKSEAKPTKTKDDSQIGIDIDDIVTIIKTSETPKEQTVKFLTDKIIQHLQSSLDVAENMARKHFSP